MTSSNDCPKCRSPKRVRGVRFIDKQDHFSSLDAELELETNPETRIHRGVQRFPIEADVCGECGYVELFVKDPAALWQAFEEQQFVPEDES